MWVASYSSSGPLCRSPWPAKQATLTALGLLLSIKLEDGVACHYFSYLFSCFSNLDFSYTLQKNKHPFPRPTSQLLTLGLNGVCAEGGETLLGGGQSGGC